MRKLPLAALALLPLACGGGDEVTAAPPTRVVTSSLEHSAEALESRGVLTNAAGVQPGPLLIAPFEGRQAYLVDHDGEELHRWDSEHPPGGSLYLNDAGELLYTCELMDNDDFYGGGINGRIEKYSWDGELLWEYELSNAEQCLHHDVEPMPNGNVLAIVWERKTREEAIAAGRDPERVLEQEGFWPDSVIEIEPTPPSGGRIVWEWHAWDHLVQDRDPALPNYGIPAEHPGRLDVNLPHEDPEDEEDEAAREELEEAMAAVGYAGGGGEDDEEDEVADADATEEEGDDEEDDGDMKFARFADWMHTNAIAYEPELDLIVLSVPEFGELLVIDHSTTTAEAAGSTGGRWGRGGDVLWRWGNPRNHDAGTADDCQLFYQHNPTWLPGPNLLLLNNGGGRADGDWTSADELVLPFDPEDGFAAVEPGEPCGPAAPSWSFRLADDLFAPFISSAERQPNGNTLVCSGPAGKVVEVTPDGEEVWRFHNTFGGDEVVHEFFHGGGDEEGEPAAEDEEDDGPGSDIDKRALFRATRVPADHPGLSRLVQ